MSEPRVLRWIAVIAVALHAIVLIAHDGAHQSLGVELMLWQTLFAYSVIVAGPPLALALLFAGRARLGWALLAASMFGALCFGVYHHYLAISPDNVAHLPPGDAQGAFRSTSWMMAAIEGMGFALGAFAYSSTRRSESGSA